ncbi:MAG: hypothetical protein ACJ75M_07775 [Actinomycetes bacterium]
MRPNRRLVPALVRGGLALAAGLAVAACGPGVRPGSRRAVGEEAGTALAGAA